MTPLRQIIQDEIKARGAIGVDDYMSLALSHPDHGYYMRGIPMGAAGDFITAPEISQMFGELIGLWLAQVWQDMGAPERFNLVELGPGSGALIDDILRSTSRVPGFAAAAKVWLVETSPSLRDAQSKRLARHAFTHASDIADVDEGPLLLIANEFFDALPIKQYQRVDERWLERMIALKDGVLEFVLRPIHGAAPDLPHAVDGAIYERAHVSEAIAAKIAARIGKDGGAALVIDYGDDAGQGDTLQALRAHERVDVLAAADGSCDLTAHVRFDDLARAFAPAKVSHTLTQGVFLETLGITARANALAQQADAAQVQAIVKAHHRLTHPDEMGGLFKVIAVTDPKTDQLPGFATWR